MHQAKKTSGISEETGELNNSEAPLTFRLGNQMARDFCYPGKITESERAWHCWYRTAAGRKGKTNRYENKIQVP